MKTTAVSQPINIDDVRDDLKHLYIDTYEYKDQEVKEYSNCFVTYNGIVLSNLQYVPDCFYSPKSYKKKYYKWALKRWVAGKITKWGRANLFKPKQDTKYSIIHQPYINYFHWTIESMLRLMVLEMSDKKAVLLIPQSLTTIKYIHNSLDILGVKYKQVDGENDMAINKLVLPSMVWWGNRYNPKLIKRLSERFAEALQQKNIVSKKHEKVFVIREIGRRKIVNADEVKKLMLEKGFFIVDFEGKTQQEQIETMAGAKTVVAQHGAGLTNILFMPPGGNVVEIYVDPAQNDYQFDDSYYILASALGHKYYSFISQKANASANFFESDHHVNVEKLAELLNSI